MYKIPDSKYSLSPAPGKDGLSDLKQEPLVESDDEQLERLLTKLGIEQVLFVLGSGFARVSQRRGDTFHVTAQQLLALKDRLGRRFTREALTLGGVR